MENNRRGNEIFLGVIGVATLVVAIIGATFAFFSASTNSNADAVHAGSTTVGLNYVDTTGTNLKSALIPAKDRVATYAALDQTGTGSTRNNQCIDDNGNEVCGVYQFTVSNPSTATTQDIDFTLDVALNTFTNLHYKIYEGEASSLTAGDISGTPAESEVKASGTFPAVASGANHQTVALNGLHFKLERSGDSSGNDSVTYTMVIWIHEIDDDDSITGNAQGDQTNADSGKSFAAQMTVTSGSGGGVTGVISAAGTGNS